MKVRIPNSLNEIDSTEYERIVSGSLCAKLHFRIFLKSLAGMTLQAAFCSGLESDFLPARQATSISATNHGPNSIQVTTKSKNCGP